MSASVARDVIANPATGFLDRTNEREMLDRLLANVREGQSAVLVIRGEAGIGKTALLRYTADQAAGFRVVQVAGAEAEMELPFAGTHQLCAPVLDHLDALPQPQRDALNVALGLASGDVPERFLVGLAVLGLLSAAAEERPLLCVVEDAQWLDAATGMILGFVARRLLAESVAMVVAVREPNAGHDFDGLPELLLRGLPEEYARTLLLRAVPGRLDDRVRDRIVGETRGNPLALLDLPRSMNAAQLAGGFGLLPATDLPRHLEDHYLRRAGELPEATQRLLLLAAAEPMGDGTLVWRAAGRLGVEQSSLAPAEDAQLVEIGTRARFRHPLVRSAVYRAAAPSERRAAHRALAEATDPETDPDRRAWHRAQAAVGVDEGVAAELERSADRARARGGAAAAAAFLARAAELTPDPAERGRRAWLPRRRRSTPGHRTRRSSCWRPPSSPGSTSSSAPGWSGCARRSRSHARAAATLRRCCSTPHGASSRSTLRWLARPISRRSRRRCSPVASAARRTSARPPRPPGLRRRHGSRHARSTCSSTG